ncbi:MAG TPA: methionine adenosyltransferase [candidate division Zixibacteria bacterium]|nr:methionine adenosyltransferase [candidate division Zixibacteria bacterium]
MGEFYIDQIDAARSDVEIVERKGVGHPDTICDLVMEHISRELYAAYERKVGRVLHYNCDKGLLIAGKVERRYGGGRVVEPMRLVIGDRATPVEEFDVCSLAAEAARSWFETNFPNIDPDRHLAIQVELKGGSEELAGIFRRKARTVAANDTSAAVGYAPLTETESLVLETERFLNGPDFKSRYPESGKDVKVMGIRKRDRLGVTVAMPLLDGYVTGERSYFRKKEEMRETLLAYLRSRLRRLREVAVSINTLDRRGAGPAGMYLSVLGTSAEDADSGEVGRGNQVNGIIALNRPRGSEAAAGKNPVSHVGKIYSVLAHLLAGRIYREVSGVEQVFVWLCSRIGDPVDRPWITSVQLELTKGAELGDVTKQVRTIVAANLARTREFCAELAAGIHPIC